MPERYFIGKTEITEEEQCLCDEADRLCAQTLDLVRRIERVMKLKPYAAESLRDIRSAAFAITRGVPEFIAWAHLCAEDEVKQTKEPA